MNIISELKNIEYSTIAKMKDILKKIGSTYSLKNRQSYVERLGKYKNCVDFTWRNDQKKVIEEFLQYKYKNYVIHAVFGSGKTTLLLGLLVHGLLKQLFKPQDVLFISFNISIKNEIKRKLKEYGISSKVGVRTFDSIIYEISKFAEYPYIDLPNYDGKRKFVYELCFDEKFTHLPSYQPSIIFIDECQDLERHTLRILNRFYPNSKFIFSGDIFQSIQKEPRESILWHFMTTECKETNKQTYKIYMSETPRVPPPVLKTIQTALNIYYPEFKDKINGWTSGNKVSNIDIEWNRLQSYTHIFQEVSKFTTKYKPTESMILTFSSAITVRGAMGDLARIRRFMIENGLPVNTNHKKMDPNTYFLSTSNSSKGLERDYVIIFLTFPLERAFINLSDDIVVNLITVALSRAKKKVIMYVPAYEDKYSRVLNIFEKCPLPDKQKITEGKTVKEFKFSDYMNIEHSVTELIRMSIVKYDTRILLKEYTKVFSFGKIFAENINHKLLPIITEEEKSFVGILIENLITSTWTREWPYIDDFKELEKNPMYNHVIGRIKNTYKRYLGFTKSNILNDKTQFDGIYIFSQIYIAMSNKIFMNLSPQLIQNLKIYWTKLKPQSHLLKPEDRKIIIQSRLQMPWIKGVADVMVVKEDEIEEIELFELKASQDFEWKDNALLQVLIYSLMTGKTWSRLHLLNPFRNEKVSYYFDSKNIMSLRNKIIQDTLIFNVNSFMAKMFSISKEKTHMDVSETLFVDISKDEKGITQACILNMVSPIKCELVYNNFVSNQTEKHKDMEKIEKLRSESTIDSKTIFSEVKGILESKVHKDKKKIGIFTDEKLGIKGITDMLKITEESLFQYLNYEADPDKKYSLNMKESLTRSMFSMCYMFCNFRFT